ncbi:MAG: hypothetical protein AB7U73_10005 [Pirellulales bacterium]
MKTAREVLERRRPVWEVLSWLFLDTELDHGQYAQIASVLHRSGYSLDELHEILFRELHPALVWNLVKLASQLWVSRNLD